MSHLADHEYLYLHHSLRVLWLHDNAVFGAVSPRGQWRVHAYLRPDEKLSDKALLEHRRRITEQRPSLPQQAGRALARIHEDAAVRAVYRACVMRKHPKPRAKGQRTPMHTGAYRLTMRVVVQPKPNLKQVARALLDLAREPEAVRWWKETHNEDGSWREGVKRRKLPKRRPPNKYEDGV